MFWLNFQPNFCPIIYLLQKRLIFNDSSKISLIFISQNAKFWSVRPKELCFLLIACSNFAPSKNSPNCTIPVSIQFQKYKYNFSPLHPPQTPSVRASAIGADAPPNHPSMSKTDLRPCKQNNTKQKKQNSKVYERQIVN